MVILIGKKIVVYCGTCGHYVELQRKKFDHIYHEVLCFLMLTGIGILVYLILKYCKKKNTCPNCETKFDLKNLPKSPNLEL
ncbi:MAG: hypothetical protein ACFFAN_01430 [Promethearchaeota archaeon]